jgi:hypothetical protein
MRTGIQLLFLAGMLALSGCKQAPPTEGKWSYDHERTKEEIAKLYTGKRISDQQLENTCVHFKKHPPMLELRKDGSFEMHRLIKTSGSFSGKFNQKDNQLFLDSGMGEHMWTLDYNKQRDEYVVTFILYPIVLSREK